MIWQSRTVLIYWRLSNTVMRPCEESWLTQDYPCAETIERFQLETLGYIKGMLRMHVGSITILHDCILIV